MLNKKTLNLIQMLFFALTIIALIVTHLLNSYTFVAYFMVGLTFMMQGYNYISLNKEKSSKNYFILGVVALIYAIYKLVV